MKKPAYVHILAIAEDTTWKLARLRHLEVHSLLDASAFREGQHDIE